MSEMGRYSLKKVDFFKWTKFSRGAGAFVGKLYGGHMSSPIPTGRPRKLITRHSSANYRVRRERSEILSPPPFFSFSTVSVNNA
jgi:hypothetical protein